MINSIQPESLERKKTEHHGDKMWTRMRVSRVHFEIFYKQNGDVSLYNRTGVRNKIQNVASSLACQDIVFQSIILPKSMRFLHSLVF